MEQMVHQADIKGLLATKDVNRLIQVLKHGGTRAMQMDAAVALGMLNDKKAIDPLIDMVNSRYSWIDIRVYSVQALGRIGGRKASKALKSFAEYKDFHGNQDDVEAIRQAAKTVLSLA